MESRKKTRAFCNVYIPPPARQRLLKQNEALSNIQTNQAKIQSMKNKSSGKSNSNELKDDSVLSPQSNVPVLSDELCNKQYSLNSKECENGDNICGSSSPLTKSVSAADLSHLCDSFTRQLDVSGRLKNIDCNHNKREEHNRNLTDEDIIDKPSPEVIIDENSCSPKENETFRAVWDKLICENQITSNITNRRPTKIQSVNKGKVSFEELNENCIIEIYDFPEELKTRDLLSIFSAYVNRGLQIRWVDDTHALGLLPSEVIAYEVLNVDLPIVKTRSLSQAIPQSKEKAKQLMPPPPPPRPVTCSASARRLVSGALGIKAVFTKAEMEAEKELLKVAREKKRTLAARQREAT